MACGLSYLHQWKPHPIIHRDISSGNVLLEPLPNSWRAKVSDYGSANFMNLVSSTVGPGCPAYSAPEASFPHQHSPKMDVYSFGVLLVEICLQELPEARPDQRGGDSNPVYQLSGQPLCPSLGSASMRDQLTVLTLRDIVELLDRI